MPDYGKTREQCKGGKEGGDRDRRDTERETRRQGPSVIEEPLGRCHSYLVALGAERVAWVTGTGLTAPATGQLPVGRGALVTFGAHHIGQTQAAPTFLLTRHISPGT